MKKKFILLFLSMPFLVYSQTAEYKVQNTAEYGGVIYDSWTNMYVTQSYALFSVGKTSSGSTQTGRGYLQFDLSSVPSNVWNNKIDAKLYVRTSLPVGPLSQSVNINKLSSGVNFSNVGYAVYYDLAFSGTVLFSNASIESASTTSITIPLNQLSQAPLYLALSNTNEAKNGLTFDGATLVITYAITTQYTVTVQSEDTNKGTVSGGGTCYEGSSVSVSASPKSGYAFEGWYLNGSKISSSASFNYTPSASCTLIAKFQLSLSISGQNFMCPDDGVTFYANNIPAGASVQWTCSSNLSKVSDSGNTAAFKVIDTNSDFAWIQIDVLGSASKKDIVVRHFSPVPVQHEAISVKPNTFYLITPPAPDVLGFIWTATPSNAANVTSSGLQGNIQFNQTGTVIINAFGINECGVSPIPTHIYVFVVQSSSSSYAAYPIPANDLLNIEISEYSAYQESTEDIVTPVTIDTDDGAEAPVFVVDGTKSKVVDPNPTFDIFLYNEHGTQLRNATTKRGTKVQFNVSNLPNGNYFLHIHDEANGTIEKRQIIVKH